jgi:shikimate dehydrogenase
MTDRYAVIGNPVAHSQSPHIHRMFAQALGEDIEYGLVLGHPGRFVDDVREFRQSGGRGLNVTVPFKLNAYSYATRRSERATHAGAVNTLKLTATTCWATTPMARASSAMFAMGSDSPSKAHACC